MSGLSLPTRIVALAGAVVALALGLLLVLVLHRSPSAAPVIRTPTPPKTHHHTLSAPVHRHTSTSRPLAHTPVLHLNRGLPSDLESALRSHPFVVVVIAEPDDSVDAATIVAAAVGANQVHAGFTLFDVRDPVTAAAVAALDPAADAPTVLIFRRSGTIAAQFSGYQDATTVAQAVLDLR